ILQNLQKKRTERRGRLSSEPEKSRTSNLVFKVTRLGLLACMTDPRRRLCFRLRHFSS
ncbi:hypothetical protein ILUMI_27532, partial [Ignelater luminosus]